MQLRPGLKSGLEFQPEEPGKSTSNDTSCIYSTDTNIAIRICIVNSNMALPSLSK